VNAPREHWFLNGVARVSSKYNPHQLLHICHLIESAQGRERTIRHGPRTIDLDLLLVGSLVLRGKDLTLPHPELHRRRFVLVPLAEIAPGLTHPKLGLAMKDLLSQCEDTSVVVRASAFVPR
jgi:2-amino-4-hydroxy-6-hydroxymethyldihydropteridine diphosphokinase